MTAPLPPAYLRLSPDAEGLIPITLSFYGERLTVRTNHSELLNQIITDLRELVVEHDPPGDGPGLTLRFEESEQVGACYFAFWREMGDALAHRFLLLHGGAVRSPGEGSAAAVLFLGPGGSGKTTLVMSAIRLGWQPMGDDLVALEWNTGRLFAVPAPYRVRPDTKRAVRAWDAITKTTSSIWSPPARTEPDSAPLLARIVLLGPDASALAPTRTNIDLMLGNLRIGKAVPREVILQRLIRGIARSEVVRAPDRPAIGETITPQLEFTRTLLSGLELRRG